MGAKTKIEWTDASWNPIRGCTRVSEGCRNCYAEFAAARFSKAGQPYHGLAKMAKDGPRWTGKMSFVDKHLQDPIRWRQPKTIFVNSMSDLFHKDIPLEWIRRIFHVMYMAPQHIYQILTKRPERMAKYTNEHPPRAMLRRIWFGTSVEDQKTVDERIPHLLKSFAVVRFVSAEPLLGPITFPSMKGISWVICGGESGRKARPFDLDWARRLRDQCLAAGVAFFMKQTGSNVIGRKVKGKGDRLEDLPKDLRIRQFPGAFEDATKQNLMA